MAARKDGLGQAFAQGNFELDQAVLDGMAFHVPLQYDIPENVIQDFVLIPLFETQLCHLQELKLYLLTLTGSGFGPSRPRSFVGCPTERL